MHGADWTPVIAAIAALILACTPSVATFILALGTHVRVGRMEQASNGKLTAMEAELRALRAEVAGRRIGDEGKP